MKPVDAKALDAKLTDPGKAGDAELKEKAVGLADVLVIGTATSRESGKYGTKTVWHRARAELRVVDLGTGRVIATFTDEAKARKPGEPDWAGRSALEALSEKVGPSVAPKLLKELGFSAQ
jgi:methanogenic corrinoid protein MtbC1